MCRAPKAVSGRERGFIFQKLNSLLVSHVLSNASQRRLGGLHLAIGWAAIPSRIPADRMKRCREVCGENYGRNVNGISPQLFYGRGTPCQDAQGGHRR